MSKGIGAKARDMIKIDSTILNKESWRKAVEILENKILKRLFDVSEYGIPSYKWLSYPSMISIWLGLFLKAESGELKLDIEKINKWYWSAIFTERYSGSTETKLAKDFKDMVLWLSDSKTSTVPEVIKEMEYRLRIMRINTKYPGSSVYKGVFNLLFKNGAEDFYEKDKIRYSPDELEDHHIFPRKFLDDKNAPVDKDIVLNKTLILSSTNRKISQKAPGVYIKEMIKIHGSEEKLKNIMKKHFIDESIFEILKSVTEDSTSQEIEKKFKEFVSRQEDLIKKEIRKLVSYNQMLI